MLPVRRLLVCPHSHLQATPDIQACLPAQELFDLAAAAADSAHQNCRASSSIFASWHRKLIGAVHKWLAGPTVHQVQVQEASLERNAPVRNNGSRLLTKANVRLPRPHPIKRHPRIRVSFRRLVHGEHPLVAELQAHNAVASVFLRECPLQRTRVPPPGIHRFHMNARRRRASLRPNRPANPPSLLRTHRSGSKQNTDNQP